MPPRKKKEGSKPQEPEITVEHVGIQKRGRGKSIGKVIETLSPTQRKDLWDFARSSAKALDIQKWIKEETDDYVSIASIQAWLEANILTGREAIAFNDMANTYAGLDTKAAQEWLLGNTGVVLAKAFTKLGDMDLDSIERPGEIMALLPGLQREFRSLASSLDQRKYIESKTALELAGGYRVAEILRQIFQGTQFERPLDHALEGALLRLEEEVRLSAKQ